MLDSRATDTPMDPYSKVVPRQEEPIHNPGRCRRPGHCRRLVEKLNYLPVTQQNIAFAFSMVSQFLDSLCDDHWQTLVHILQYIKSSPSKGLFFRIKVMYR